MEGTYYLVDGTALAYRSHFAFINNPLTNSKGQQTSAAFGFVTTLLRLMREDKPDFLAVAFDRPEPTFRKERFPEYKATREKAPPEMIAQFPWIKELTEALGVPVLELAGFEADDLIGTAARHSVAPLSASTSTGTRLPLIDPSPSSPSSLYPHATRAPSEHKARLW